MLFITFRDPFCPILCAAALFVAHAGSKNMSRLPFVAHAVAMVRIASDTAAPAIRQPTHYTSNQKLFFSWTIAILLPPVLLAAFILYPI